MRSPLPPIGTRLRPFGQACGLLAVGLIGASASALAQDTIDLATNIDLVIHGARAGDQSGHSVSGAGDLNGDGLDDLIIGAPYGDPKGRGRAGASYVIFGRAPGFPPVIDLATDADVVIHGARADDQSGFSVSGAGDVNGDGLDDLILGAPLADPKGRYGAGASYVIFGSDQGWPRVINLRKGADVVIQGAAELDLSGWSVSGAGDVNGDGLDDLIIGARQASPRGRGVAGASYVVFGANNLPGIIDLADPVTGVGLIIQGAVAFDLSGDAVSGAGDVNGDGLDDLLIGAPGKASYLILGSDHDVPATIDLATDADVVFRGLGRRVSDAGDVNGDGLDDLLIGAGTGPSYLILGSERLPATIDLAADADVVIQGKGGAVSDAGDLNGDGLDDLLIGAPYASPDGRREAGRSFVVYGTDRGLPTTIKLAREADLIIQGAVRRDLSGSAVSGAGDLNGDGFHDLLIGAPYADPNGRRKAGASYVIFGAPDSRPAAALKGPDGADQGGGSAA